MFQRYLRAAKKGRLGSLLASWLLAMITIFTLSGQAAAATTASVSTTHWKDGTAEGYELLFQVTAPLGNLNTVTVTGAPGIAAPASLAVDNSRSSASLKVPAANRPQLTDSYALTVKYLDGSPDETLTVSPTAVLDAFAGTVAPSGGVASSTAPTFSWTAPSPAPADFPGYLLSVSDYAGPIWNASQISTSATSVPFNFDGSAFVPVLTPVERYFWSLAVVDSKGNRAETRASFMLGANFQGKVTDSALQGVAGVLVSAQDLYGTAYPPVATAADGSYIYGGLAAGSSYRIWFTPPTGPTVYYNNKPSDTPGDFVPMVSGTVVSGIDAVVGSWGAVSGKVVNRSSAAVPDVLVNVSDANGTVISSIPGVTTKADGTFFLPLIPSGNSYSIKFSGASKGYSDQSIPVSVTAGRTSYLDDTVLVTENITGKVINGLGAAIAKISVFVLDAITNKPLDFAPFFYFAQTQADGSYVISGIPAGNYKLLFLDPSNVYTKQYYNAKATAAEGQTVTVTTGSVLTGINALLTFHGLTSTTVASSVNPTLLGQSTTLTATVTGVVVGSGTPAGTVTFKDGATVLGSATLNSSGQATFATSSLAAGSRSLTAVYQGTTSFNASVSPALTQTVNQPLRPLTVSLSGTGNGSVYSSNPTGIACATGSSTGCSLNVLGGSVVTLTPSVSSNSVFGGWTGACSGSGSCQIAMDSAKAVTAIFNPKPATVRIDGSATAYYGLGAALDAISTGGQTVRAKGENFVEQVIMTSPVTILFKGGFTDDAFSTRTTSSFTVLQGSLKIRQGTLKVDRLKVQ